MPKYYRVRTPEQWDWLADKLNIYCVKSMACPVIIEHEQGQKDYRIVQYYGGFEPIIEVSQMMEESRMEDYVTIKSEDLDKIKFNRPQEDGNSFVVNKINVISEKPVKCVRDVELPTDLLIPKSLLYPKVKFTEEEKREFDDIKKHVTALYNAMVLIFEHRDECINLNNKLFYSAPPKYLNDVQRDFARALTDPSLIDVIPEKKYWVKCYPTDDCYFYKYDGKILAGVPRVHLERFHFTAKEITDYHLDGNTFEKVEVGDAKEN